MPYALVKADRTQVVTVFAEVPASLRLPTGEAVQGAKVDWSGLGYAVVEVVPFVVPEGFRTVGEPSYFCNGDGTVTETYATDPVPPEAVRVTSLEFYNLFTSAEQAAIATLSRTDVKVDLFMKRAAAAGILHMDNPEVMQGIAYLVANGVLSQDRTSQITAGQAPA